VVVFRDKHPAALEHLQAVPRPHITNLDSLQPSAEDYALGKSQRSAGGRSFVLPCCCIVAVKLQSFAIPAVEELWKKGEQVLEQLKPGAQHRFGFHRPPFNSVQHLQ